MKYILFGGGEPLVRLVVVSFYFLVSFTGPVFRFYCGFDVLGKGEEEADL